jgi:hypothetical protein
MITGAKEVVHRNVEEALNLRLVQVHCQERVGAGQGSTLVRLAEMPAAVLRSRRAAGLTAARR